MMTSARTVIVIMIALSIEVPSATRALADMDHLAADCDRQVEPPPDLGSMVFLSPSFPRGEVKLSRGEYREPAAPGSASEVTVRLSDKRAFGVVNGGRTGVAVIATSRGGTGTYYDLALLSHGEKGWVNTDTVLLGDRVIVHSVDIREDGIDVVMTTHGAGDPMSCPTLEVRKRFTVQGARLVEAAGGVTGGGPQMTGTIWQWVQTVYADDSRSVPGKPKDYTVRFLPDGTVDAKADCNRKGGTYSTAGDRLSIEFTHSTMAECGTGSLERPFTRDLATAATFRIENGDLYIEMGHDGGTMRFSARNAAGVRPPP